jgi:hypothetical protein
MPCYKFPSLFEVRPCVRFEFLKTHEDTCLSIKKACKVLKVSRSGYYEYFSRKKSNQQIHWEALERRPCTGLSLSQ